MAVGPRGRVSVGAVRRRTPLADLPNVIAPGSPDVLLAALADSDQPVQSAVFAAVADAAPDAVLFAGDAAYAGTSDRRRRAALRRWREDWGPLAPRVYAVPGNHDFDSPGGPRLLARGGGAGSRRARRATRA